ncbi:hypothetical protein SUDANB1_05583 [Streptomyces sp. enrichment culture]|uniref:hypothetical protein n=1 Tax=Streptomyces sp. enrichment culture TaxID=1795815 RepID=UPI003F579A78
MIETFGPEYVRPAPAACPDCACCSARLCERGRSSVHQCGGISDKPETVKDCPCSAPTARGTHAWRLERIRAVRYAVERPLEPAEEAFLRALADGEDGVQDPAGVVKPLTVRGFLRFDEEARMLRVTEFGRTYLSARDDARFVTPVHVEAVDLENRTARVVVVGWHITEPVTVLLDQLIHETGLSPAELPGSFLEAAANCRAEDRDDLVLTAVRVAPPLPEGWMDGTVTSGE